MTLLRRRPSQRNIVNYQPFIIPAHLLPPIVKYKMIPVFNVGLVGYGLSAKVFQLPFFKVVPQLRVHAILQRSPKPDNDAEKDYPGVKIYRTTREMFQDCAIDLAIIGTSSDSHYSICKQALLARKNGSSAYIYFFDRHEANFRGSFVRKAIHFDNSGSR